jgi:hypothetical protein
LLCCVYLFVYCVPFEASCKRTKQTVMSIAGNLCEAYTKLVSSDTVRGLLSHIKGHHKEGLDLLACWTSLQTVDIKSPENKAALFAIRGWLETVAYSIEALPDVWLWNMNFRLRKFLVLMMCLERLNYQSICDGKDPVASDLPSYFVTIHQRLTEFDQSGTAENLRKAHVAYIKKHHEFFDLYTGLLE